MDVLHSGLACLAALVGALILTPWVGALARKRGWVDAGESARKLHKIATPRLGGLAVVAAFALALALASLSAPFRSHLNAWMTLWVVVGAALIVTAGAIDDFRGLGAKPKLAAEVLAGVCLYAAGIRLDVLQLPGVGTIHLGLFALPATCFWIAAFANAVNLIDGLDGLAGGLCVLALGCEGLLALAVGNFPAATVALCLAGAFGGFLVFNWRPASIFMGDTGALFGGAALGALTLVNHRAPTGGLQVLWAAAVLAVAFGDTFLAIVRRSLRGRGVFSADKEHLHHCLLNLGWNHQLVALALHCFSAACCCAVSLHQVGSPMAAVLLVGLVVAGLAAAVSIGVVPADLGVAMAQRRRNLELKAAVRSVCAELEKAEHPDDLVAHAETLAPVLDASVIRIRLRGDEPRIPTPLHVTRLAQHHFSLRLPIGTPAEGYVEALWDDGRVRPDIDHEHALVRVAEGLRNALRRGAAVVEAEDHAGKRSVA